MKEQLISFETSKLAKEKGFPQNLFNTGWYNRFEKINGRVDITEKGENLYHGLGTYVSEPKIKVSKENYKKYTYVVFSAPSQSLLQKWLREKHSIHIMLHYEISMWSISLDKLNPKSLMEHAFSGKKWLNYGKSYEEALEKGLQEALKLIK